MTLHVWPARLATGAQNMALDEAAMRVGRAGDFVLRTYRWDPHCVSLGRNQPTGDRLGEAATRDLVPGLGVVRRPTGGRSVFHGPELTYAFVAPERGFGGPRGIYRAVHAALASALSELGVPLDDVPAPAIEPARGAATEPTHDPARDETGDADALPLALDQAECFITPAPGEITTRGRKLVGSAQWRHRGAVLQHGSVLFANQQSRASEDGLGGAGAIGLDEIGPVPAFEDVGAGLAAALARQVGCDPTQTAPPTDVTNIARELEVRYSDAEWTWRR